MNKQLLFRTLTSLLLTVFVYSCQPKEPVTEPVKRVKYEITGNYTGQLIVVFTDYTGSGNITLSNVSFPFSREINYSSSVYTIGIGAQSSVAGVAGQTATMKISVDGVVVKTSSATAGNFGEIIFPTLAHSF